MRFRIVSYLLAASVLLCACMEDEPVVNKYGEISVGGVFTDPVLSTQVQTKASAEQNAEDLDWLQDPLETGLDITYGNLGFSSGGDRLEKNKHVAVLKLLTNDDGSIKYSTFTEDGVQKKMAEYSFLYKVTESGADGEKGVEAGQKAIWYDNGPHFFEGVYVPSELRQGSTPANLTTDQSGDNYTHLTHYLAMPADCQISATISRIRLPFKHRLSRVLAYVLIDPEMGNDITIRGYKGAADGGTENPATSEIRFSKVKVLRGVNSNTNGSFTPVWSDEVRKVIPHYVGENGGIRSDGTFIEGNEFVMYHHKKRDEYIAPSSDKYAEAEAGSTGTNPQYEKIVYKNAPCYDLIVEPSYSDVDQVMYDEEGYYGSDGKTVNETKRQELASLKNKIHFEVTLSNGLKYEKEFQFNDLDANYQTVVYLRIQRESVDYDNSGSMEWINDNGVDGWYGLDNANDHTLSRAGSSWQRAYRIPTGSINIDYTDGGDYSGTQYIDEAAWKEAFLAATEKGSHHGDYFVLDQDIAINVPEGFVFTGHLDAKGHTLTLNGHPFGGLNGIYTTPQESKPTLERGEWTANVHKEGSYWVPVSGYRAEIMNAVFDCSSIAPASLFVENAQVSGYVYNCKYSDGTKIPDNIPSTIPTY